jgi:hypothetical protein
LIVSPAATDAGATVFADATGDAGAPEADEDEEEDDEVDEDDEDEVVEAPWT